jgi:hypothetical protein
MRNPRKWTDMAEQSKTLLKFQEKMSKTRLIVFDEISMVGKQMMGKISARCQQAKTAAQNPTGDALGGLSCIGVGDPAQCPPISDEAFYDPDAHRDTTKEPDAQRVRLSNRGKTVYDTFKDVIILQFCHRVHRRTGENLTDEDKSYNARGQKFLEIMGRLRDCEWTFQDYYWLLERHLSRLSITERAAFAEAPLIMEFRKERPDATDEDDSCDAYNRRMLYALAQEKDRPVAKFTALYSGVSSEEGADFDDELFGGLAHTLELCEGAPVIYTHNLWVSAGLMNGTRGVLRAIVYRDSNRPDHTDPTKRLPAVVLVECESYAGEPFFDINVFPTRRQWIPYFPRDMKLETDSAISRAQISLTLAWALTPWKAQGMSLEKVVVKLGKAASKPGVAFVALTRARHPDGLAIADKFPAYFEFQKQKTQDTFKKRQRFERIAKARFSETIRNSMRDATIYSSENVWSEYDADIATALLDFLNTKRDLDDDAVPEAYIARTRKDTKHLEDATELMAVERVWARLLTQDPHPFAVAQARGTLDKFKQIKQKVVEPAKEPWTTQLSFRS